LLRAGDRAIVVIPPNLGYGDDGSDVINVPAKATLQYDIEVIALKKQHLSEVMKRTIDAGGIAGGQRLMQRFRRQGFGDVYEGEIELNFLGYVYLTRQNRMDEAIALFKWNTELYPSSADARGLLAEAYLLNDQRGLALQEYRRALELGPQNESSSQWKKTIGELTASPPGPTELALLRKRMHFAEIGIDGDTFVANLPLAVDVLQERLEQYLEHAKPQEEEEATKLVAQFLGVVRLNKPELMDAMIRKFLNSDNAAARKAAAEAQRDVTPR
jgi:tetratricopeptide (TPR) repeat protein